MQKIILTVIILAIFSGCSKDRDFPYPPYKTPNTVNIGSRQLIHYYNFNNSLTIPTQTIGTTEWKYDGLGIFDAVTDPSTLNARNNDVAGSALRLRNPSNSIIFNLPTNGYKNVVFSYATKRSNSGAQLQKISYSVDGGNYITDNLGSSFINVDTTWQLYSFDLSNIQAANDNSDFKIKIDFSVGNTSATGNNRFDNITLDADSIPGGGLGKAVLLNYWNFNNSDTTKAVSILPASLALDFATVGTTTGYFDFTTSNARANLRNGADTGNCLRVRNPVNSFTIKSSTVGYKNIKLAFECGLSSASAAQNSQLFYSTDGGATFSQAGLTNANYSPTIIPNYGFYAFNLSNLVALNNNPNVQFKIVFSNGNLGISGNNRLDNITIEGYKQ